jgi:hypothetical protein
MVRKARVFHGGRIVPFDVCPSVIILFMAPVDFHAWACFEEGSVVVVFVFVDKVVMDQDY